MCLEMRSGRALAHWGYLAGCTQVEPTGLAFGSKQTQVRMSIPYHLISSASARREPVFAGPFRGSLGVSYGFTNVDTKLSLGG